LAIIKKIEPIGLQDVYNMEVEGHHNFSVNGGLIVHNCRYFVMSRPAISVSMDELRERRAKRRKGTAPVISRITGY
jgi:hypothetical protein